MGQKKELTKAERIAKERRRLTGLFRAVEERKKKTVLGLIERAAFLRVTLDELEENLREGGTTEQFSQGNQEPYTRERPESRIYATLNANYQKIIKQLTDLLPKDEPGPKQEGDAFDAF